jgi:hypothetical protein
VGFSKSEMPAVGVGILFLENPTSFFKKIPVIPSGYHEKKCFRKN